MAQGKNKLSAIAVRNAAPGVLHDGGGLMLDKAESGGKWLYRYSIAGRQREMGLGAYPEVSIAAARVDREKWVAVLQSGLDPISERTRRLAAVGDGPTLQELVEMVFESRKAGLRGERERGRWMSPLRMHVLPKLGKRKVVKIYQTDIRDAIAPIWRKKTRPRRKQ